MGCQGASVLSPVCLWESQNTAYTKAGTAEKSYKTLPNPAACQQEGITARGTAAELSTQESWDRLLGFDRLSLASSTEENP